MSKEAIVDRRNAVVSGVLGGLAIHGFIHLSMGDVLARDDPPRSFFFDDIDHWPSFVHSGWTPIDVFMTCVYFTTIMYLASRYPSTDRSKDMTKRDILVLFLGFFAAFASIGGLMGTVMVGWFSGFEFAIMLGSIMMLVLLGFLAAFAVLVFIGYFLGEIATRLWVKIQDKSLARPIVAAGDYLAGNDIPDETNGNLP